MNRRYRKTIIAGNWKMNMVPSQVKGFVEELKPMLPKTRTCDVVLCPPYPLLPAAVKAVKGCRVDVGAQNISEFASGAHTGEVSLSMITDLGARYVILGHSERRADNGETDLLVNAKTLAALGAGLRPIVCVGESEQERERGLTMERIAYQVKSALWSVTPDQLKKVVIAYEPIWAIGTGKTATAAQAQEVCQNIRALLRELYGARAARGVSILYGGSMNAKNAAELLSQPDIDGGLIGGASLKPADFAAIIAATAQE